MDKFTFNRIIQLNKVFYENISKEFDETRQYPWKGWGRARNAINNHFSNKEYENGISILDLGCGNGRFYEFSTENIARNILEYVGLDTDNNLLIKAKEKYIEKAHETHSQTNILDLPAVNRDVTFKNVDVIQDLESNIDKKFDLIVCFGVTHHIPSSKFRKTWFKNIKSLLNEGGLFIFTTWNYDKDKRFIEKSINPVNIDSNLILEENDFFIGWDDKKVYRYVHIYDDSEIKELISQSELKLIETYDSDGRGDNLNSYYILSKD